MRLNIKQTIALDYLEDNITTEVEYGGGAGGGKSILGCYWQIKRRLKYPGTRGLIGRASLKTLKETTLNSFFEVCKLQGLRAGQHFTYNQQTSTINFVNGSLIFLKDLFLYPTDPNFDELGSLEITDAFIDENNQVVEKAWNIVKSRIRYKLDEHGLIPKMLGCCNPSKGWIYTRFYKPSKEGTLPPDRRFVQALVGDNPDISKYYYTNLLSLDKASKERLLYGNWEYDDSPDALIDYDKILSIFSNHHVPEGRKAITCDVARLGGDRIVVIEWDGFRGNVKAWQKQTLDVTAQFIEDARYRMHIGVKDVLVDEDGMGGGLVDFGKYHGFVNNSQPLPSPGGPLDSKGNPIRENYSNLKSQCYFRLAERINKNELFLRCEDNGLRQLIIEELEQVKRHKMDSDGKLSVLPKEKVKEVLGRSPDFADTLMMREWFELRPKRSWASA